MLVEGDGVAALIDLLRERLGPVARRSIDNPQVLIVEDPPRLIGCASGTVVVCSEIEAGRIRLTVVRSFHCFAWTDRAKLRPLAPVLSEVAKISEERGWIRDDVSFLW